MSTDLQSSVERLDLNKNLLQIATNALQAQEQLNWLISQQSDFDSQSTEAKKVHECLDILRTQKASLEKSDEEFRAPCIIQDDLLELKQLTLMHTPTSVTDAVKEKFRELVEKALEGQSKKVISITLLTCPWFEASQRERGEQAKHNILLIVFSNEDSQFFSPVNPQIRENACVIDFGWFNALELSHFGHSLCKGRTRYLEAIFCRPGADIYCSEEWEDLKGVLDYMISTGTPNFLEACLGQAVGGVAKKRKHGGMRLREGATVFEQCASLRHLQLVDNTVSRGACQGEIDEASLCQEAVEALTEVKKAYHSGDLLGAKQRIFHLIMAWTDILRPQANAFKAKAGKKNQVETESIIGGWLLRARLQGRTITPHNYLRDEAGRLQELLQNVGGPVAEMDPGQIILVAVAGSAMYNLSTKSSDVDYIVVYATPTETLMSATKKLPECQESRGKDKDVEYGSYEARLLCEMLLKCSVVILELLFTGHHEYISPLWQELAKHKQAFVTEKAISQYLGLIKNNLRSISKEKHSDSPKQDRKLFYQNFHKLHSVRSMLKGQLPEVRMEDGPDRDFIMSVRTKEDAGEWSREKLLAKLEREYRSVREDLCARTERLRENPDYNICMEWLTKVRAISG